MMSLLLAFVVVLVIATVMFAVKPTEKMGVPVNLTRKVTLHYTNWCHYCKLMKPVWSRVKKYTEGSGIVYAEVDEDINRTAGIYSYPTIMMTDEYGRVAQYPGGADFESLRAWVLSPSIVNRM